MFQGEQAKTLFLNFFLLLWTEWLGVACTNGQGRIQEPKPDRMFGSCFGFEVLNVIVWYLLLLYEQKPNPQTADIRSGFEN